MARKNALATNPLERKENMLFCQLLVNDSFKSAVGLATHYH